MCRKLISLWSLGLAWIALTSVAALAFEYDLRIAAGIDDVEEYVGARNMYVDSSDLELPYEDDGNPPTSEQVIGLRWMVPVPAGSQILKAYVELECDETKGGTNPVNLIIEGQLAPNAPAFTTATGNVTDRIRTQAQVKWAMPTWTKTDVKTQSPDLSPVLQEIIDQPGWSPGNALVLIVRDDKGSPSMGIRCVEAYEGEPTAAALLHIEVFSPAASKPDPAHGATAVTNALLGWTKGDDALSHNVYLGVTPELTEANLVAKNQAFTMYYHGAGFEPGATYYWRVDEIGAAGKVTPGQVWSFTAQALMAYLPEPADGAVNVSLTPAMKWLPGQLVAQHHLYFSDDPNQVLQGAAETDKGLLTETSLTAGPLTGATTYYWRVDEIVVDNSVRTGSVWNFTTYLPVDDFERYTDEEGSRIYEAWTDGWTNNTGAVVGNLTAPFAEQTIVHAGKQAMPIDYDNTKAPFYSEAEEELTPAQDWTVNGATDLTLYFRGRAANGPGSVHVAVTDNSGNSAVAIQVNAAAVTLNTWTEWKIPLSSFAGVDLSKVQKLSIGVGDRNTPVAGGTGRIYIDDIRVTKP